MTIMFTHKSTDAWDALTIGIIEAGFRITATWPVKTEPDAVAEHPGPRCGADQPYCLPVPTKDRTVHRQRVLGTGGTTDNQRGETAHSTIGTNMN